jgi:antitoxin component of RelBE/YafQ-DinJ toxin-antitoxin module
MSDENSQPIAGQGDSTRSPTRSEDIFGPFSDALQDTVLWNDSLTGGDQQQDDTRQDQRSGDRPQYAELQPNRLEHTVQQEALEHHSELRIRSSQDTPTNSEDELALMNIPESNVIPTFLTAAVEETEPFEPKTLRQAMDNTSWPKWENAMIDEVNSHQQNKTWELVDPPKDRRVLSGK